MDAPLEEAFARARAAGTPLFVNDVDVGTGDRPPLQCNLQISPLLGHPGKMLFLVAPRELASRMTQSHSVKSAAKSAIGMAEMLAHEIKNPLAGIAGAAQLLSMNLGPEDLELTDLIVGETRRIVKLLEQVEQFGNLSEPARKAMNLHDVLDRARRSALLGFGAHMKIVEQYDPSLPLAWADPDQLLQVVLNLLKNAAQAAPDGGKIVLRTYYEHAFRLRRADGTLRHGRTFSQCRQRTVIQRIGFAEQEGERRRRLKRSQQPVNRPEIDFARAPPEIADRLEAMLLDGLDHLRFRRLATIRHAECAVIHVTSGTPGDLTDLRWVQVAMRVSVELPHASKGDMVEIEVEAHPDSVRCYQIVDIAILVEGHLGVAGARG